MLLARNLVKAAEGAISVMKRGITIGSYKLNNTSDPLEQLYNEKLAEYKDKSSGGKIVEPTEEILQELESEFTCVAKKFDAENAAELETFPKFKFEEPTVDPIIETLNETLNDIEDVAK